MSVTFNVGEIYEMAVQIEKNGAAFYRKAAKCFSEQATRGTLRELAAMEDRHRETFEAMGSALPAEMDKEQWYDPHGEAVRYLQVFASGHVFDVTVDPGAELKDTTSPGEILMMALGKERDSIMFYLGLRRLTPDPSERDRINDIIQEEMGHITVLHDQLDLYGGV